MKKLIMMGAMCALMLAGTAAMACTNFLFTKGATKDGSCMITYAADSHTLYGELYYRQAADYKAGEEFMLVEWDTGKPLFKIPQVAHTYSVVGNMNEHALAISETTFGGREECWKGEIKGIDYGSLIYVTLQRAKNAREAIKTIGWLLDNYGYCSEGESFSICDQNEVWIMEIQGKRQAPVDAAKAKKLKYTYKDGAVWVARRVPDGYVCGHANQARITTFPQQEKKSFTAITYKNIKEINRPEVECVYSDDIITYARACGWFDGQDKDFSFTDTYAPLTFSGIRGCDARVFSMFRRVSKEMNQYEDYAMGWNKEHRMPLWIKPDHKIDVKEAMDLMRDHYEGTKMDMTQDVGAGPFKCPYRWRPMGFEVNGQSYVHERATSTQQTGFSFVAQSRPYVKNTKVAGILWFGVDDTYSTCYCPMFCGITKIPECFREGNGDMLTYSATSAFWLFNRVTNFVYSRYQDMIADLKIAQNELEVRFIKEAERITEKASNAKDEEVEKLLTTFSNRQADMMMKRWNQLDQFLLVKYIDGNVKKETKGKFARTEYGMAEFPEQPKYPDSFYKAIVKEHGDVVIVK